MKESDVMSANELGQILTTELRTLSEMPDTDRNAARKIDKAKQVFNGAGKLIALSAYVTEARRLGQPGIMSLPEPESNGKRK